MAAEDRFRSDHQLWNQPFDDNESDISYQDGYPSPGGSSHHGSPLSFSDLVVHMPPYLNAQYVQSNQANSGTSFDESSLINGLNSSLYGGLYSHGLGFNGVESLSPVSGSSTVDQLSVHEAPISPMMMYNNLRLETMLKDTVLPNNPSQMALWQEMQWKCYNDFVRMFEEKQNPYRLNIQPLLCEAGEPQEASNTVVNAELAVRRLKSYVHHRRQRPLDNSICYWRSFVGHFYSPLAKKKTCFSKYAHLGGHSHGVFSSAETWNCEICGSTSGKGFVETFDILPRMNQLYFNAGGVVDELLYLDISNEKRLPDGSLMLCFLKAIQESIYKQCRVVHEGKLRVIFTPQLKIISWDFCVQHHEVVLPRRLIAAQVNDVIKGATKSKNNVDTEGRDGIQNQDFPSNGNRVAAAARKLATTVEQPHVSDLGLSKHFVRSLQVSELLNVMKDLMTESLNNNTSPIETLKRYGRKSTNAKLGKRHMKFKSPMQQTSDPPTPNAHLLVKSGPSHTFQTPINYHDGIYYNSPTHCQNRLFAQVASYSSPFPSPISPAQTAFSPSFTRKSPYTEEFMLNDLLAHMQRQTAKRALSENMLHGGTQKKSRLNSTQVNNELTTDRCYGRKAETGKALNSSSSSNSSRMFQNRKFFKRETDVDDDFTSPA
ncbi:hypothetical protein RND81_13G041000 [Saponaria officinalis]|uniref:Uncharacterized protein n=1 Tax=Saponaria officinalis TaxID=3572 RepID=A0AAW1H0B3_SAPOF